MAGTLIRGDSFKENVILSEVPDNVDFVRVSLTQCGKLIGELWYEPSDISKDYEVLVEIPPEITRELIPNEQLIFSASVKLLKGFTYSSSTNTSVIVRDRPNLKPVERPYVK